MKIPSLTLRCGGLKAATMSLSLWLVACGSTQNSVGSGETQIDDQTTAPMQAAAATSGYNFTDSLASQVTSSTTTSWRSRDNNYSTYFETSGLGQWIRYDLGGVKRIGGISVAWYKGTQRKVSFEVAVSSDMRNWKTVTSRLTSSGTTTALEEYDFPDVDARYVKVVFYGNTIDKTAAIYEAAAFAPNDTTTALVPTPAPTTDYLTPEQYGAKGDGSTDDTQALLNFFKAANSSTKAVAFGAGKTYLTGRTNGYQFNITRDGMTVEGNGATIKVKDGTPTSTSLYVLRIAAQNVTVSNLTVDGNKAKRDPVTNWNQFGWFVDGGTVNLRLKGVRGINSPVDNLYVRDQVSGYPSASDASYPRNLYFDNIEMLNATRNNASFISSKDVYITGGKFNGAGPGNPGTGIDFEPNQSADLYGNSNINLNGVETSNNYGGGIDIAGYYNNNITIRNHIANNNGTAIFAMPDASTITVDGLTGSNYSTNPTATQRNGFISLVPGGRTGGTVVVRNVKLSGINSNLPVLHQNYSGNVTYNDAFINQYSGTRVTAIGKATNLYNIYRDGVKVQ